MSVSIKSLSAKGVSISPDTKDLIQNKLDSVALRLPELNSASVIFAVRPHTKDIEVKVTVEGGHCHLRSHGVGKNPSLAFREAVKRIRRSARRQSEKRSSERRHYSPRGVFRLE